MLKKVMSLLVIGMCLSLFLTGQVYAKNVRSAKILVLNSDHKGFHWVDSIVEAVESGLSAEVFNYDLRVEYMDTEATNYNAAYKKSLYAFYSSKYDNYKFDVIICSDDHAFDFLNAVKQNMMTVGTR